jgi:putative phage-type endonuclease
MIQGSPEWFAIRCGKVTASRVADVVARTKTGWGASRANYAAQLVAERLTGKAAEGFSSKEMQWGTETEPQARDAYSFIANVDVAQVAFIPHPHVKECGASPDGLVGDEGLVEIKCPNTATHIDTLLGESLPNKYILQMQWQMACTGRQWCDFVSFDPRMPESMQIYIERVKRDEEQIKTLEKEITAFLTELALKVDALKARYLTAKAA